MNVGNTDGYCEWALGAVLCIVKMAVMSNNSTMVLKFLEEELKCPLCLDIFTEPRKLQCDHVVCLQCLEELVVKSRAGSLSCPLCRDATQLEGSGTSQFPVAHQINRLVDIYHKILQEQSASTKEPQLGTCSVHTTQPLAIYCETCQKAICRDCFIASCSIKRHEWEYLEDLAKKQKRELEKMLQPVRQLRKEMVASLVALSDNSAELEVMEKEQLEEINSGFASISLNLAKEKVKITTEVKNRYKAQLKRNLSKKEELQAEVATLSEAIESAKDSIIESDPVRIFTKMSEQRETLSTLCNERKNISCLPNISAELYTKFKIDPELFNSKQGIFRAGQNYQCLLEEYENLKSLVLKQPFHIHFHLTELSPKKIKAKFICALDDTSTSVSVTEVERDVVKLSFTPQKRGRHYLQILYSDEDAFGSPITSFVQCPPQIISALGRPKKLSVPAAGLKCINDKIYVSSASLVLNILEFQKQNLCITKQLSIPGLNEMLVHENKIYYTNLFDHKLVMASSEGTTIKCNGGFGPQPGNFNFPNGIRMSKDQEIFVCDSNNHRIQVFSTDLTLRRIIGKMGLGFGKFLKPCDLVFDKEGNMYVVENGNHRVQVLSPQGEHIRYIGREGVVILHQPVSAAILGDHIYITNRGNNCISVYKLSGEYVVSFGEKEGTGLECIDIDQDGFIYVTHNKSTVLRY